MQNTFTLIIVIGCAKITLPGIKALSYEKDKSDTIYESAHLVCEATGKEWRVFCRGTTWMNEENVDGLCPAVVYQGTYFLQVLNSHGTKYSP